MGLSHSVLLEYIRANFGLDDAVIDDDTFLFSSGLLDSLSMVELIAFVESEANIRVRAAEVSLDNLDSVRRILEFVDRKR